MKHDEFLKKYGHLLSGGEPRTMEWYEATHRYWVAKFKAAQDSIKELEEIVEDLQEDVDSFYEGSLKKVANRKKLYDSKERAAKILENLEAQFADKCAILEQEHEKAEKLFEKSRNRIPRENN